MSPIRTFILMRGPYHPLAYHYLDPVVITGCGGGGGGQPTNSLTMSDIKRKLL